MQGQHTTITGEQVRDTLNTIIGAAIRPVEVEVIRIPIEQYARRRVAALKPMPVNQWIKAAEDILVHTALATAPELQESRARRLVRPHAASLAVALRTWRGA